MLVHAASRVGAVAPLAEKPWHYAGALKLYLANQPLPDDLCFQLSVRRQLTQDEKREHHVKLRAKIARRLAIARVVIAELKAAK